LADMYKVVIGRDEYLGSADEVVAFMAKSEGAPGEDAGTYMRGVAARVAVQFGVDSIATDSTVAFLDSLAKHRVVQIEVHGEPLDERVDPREAVGDGPLAYGPGVNPDDVDLD